VGLLKKELRYDVAAVLAQMLVNLTELINAELDAPVTCKA
jgi:hypothetical protein